MNVVFASNFLSHHQKLLCDCLSGQFDSFHFLSFKNSNSGYQKPIDAEYVIHFDENLDVNKFLNQVDVIIIGSVPLFFLKIVEKIDCHIFIYTERFFKKTADYFNIKKWIVFYYLFIRRRKRKYVLCASAYVYREIRFFIKKSHCFKFGYFPNTIKYADIDNLVNLKESFSIMWAGRFIKWKHPEVPIIIAEKLKRDGYFFHLHMIGDGREMSKILSAVKNKNLNEYISFTGSIENEETRKYMEKACIYLFTSNKQEGWGAVVNEAMNSGCVVVANASAGSVPYLINDKSNGLIYKKKNINLIFEEIKHLLDNQEYCKKIGKEAYFTIIKEWNAEVAALRLSKLMNGISKQDYICGFLDGPCSKI